MADLRINPVYAIPLESGSGGFITISDRSEAVEFTQLDMERSRLDLEDMGIKPALHQDANYSSQYYLPYFAPDGQVIVDQDGTIKMFRLRGELTAKGRSEKRGKYTSPGREQVQELSGIPYIHPRMGEVFAASSHKILAICEGEKKAVSLMKYADIAAIGIGGKDMWHKKGEQTKLHPWISEVIESLNPDIIMVIPDGDVRKFHIEQSFGSLARLLMGEGHKVHMPLLPHQDDKIDDLINGKWLDLNVLEELERCNPVTAYVETVARLRDVYNLQTVGDPPRVPINESNLTLLVQNHPVFEDLWYNIDTQRIFMGDKELTDSILTGVLGLVQRSFSMAMCRRGTLRDVLEHVAREDRGRSPWKEYLMGLEWDGTERLKSWMVDYCNATSTPMALEGPLKWLVGAVARIFEPGCAVDYMLITIGAQGIGKSSIPKMLWKQGIVTSIGGHLKDTDLYTAMHSSHCANFEELGAMYGKELTHLKTMISDTTDTYRRKYSRDEERRPRDFVLYGSTNTPQFLLADDTGQRRYVIVECGQVEFKKLEADCDQLWAEATHLYNSGEIDYSMVEAAKSQGTLYVDKGTEYYQLLDVVLNDYEVQGTTEKPGYPASIGEVKTIDGTEYLCAPLGKWREAAGMSQPRGRQGAPFNNLLRSMGWVEKGSMRIRSKPCSKVWCCPTSLLAEIEC